VLVGAAGDDPDPVERGDIARRFDLGAVEPVELDGLVGAVGECLDERGIPC
jgi:hypothetical protein